MTEADSEDGVPAGPILDEMGVRFGLDPDDRVTEVLVLAKTTDLATGAVGLNIAASGGLDWVAQLGLLIAGRLIIERGTEVEPS